MVLLVAAEGRELAGVLRHCVRRERLWWDLAKVWRGKLNGRAVVLAADGPGRNLAAGAVRTACQRERVEAVVSIGWCGALDAELAPGEILVASRVETEDGAAGYDGAVPRTGRRFHAGLLVTVDRVVDTVEQKVRLRERGGVAVDMEAAGVAAEAARLGLAFSCIRVVLDGARENLGLDLNAARGENGRFSRRKILAGALSRPWRGVPELARWAWRVRMTARLLGDFLAECQLAD
jgi:nucleoside phosphorylase